MKNKKIFFDSLRRASAGYRLPVSWIQTVAFCFAICFSGGSATFSNAQEIQWYPDIATATPLAKEQNKLILLHFTATWCNPCRNLETFVFTSRDVQRAFHQNVIAVKIDADANPHLVQEYGVASVPFDVAVTTDGRVVSKRKSPVDAIAYHKMVSDFQTIIHFLSTGDAPALNQNLAELKQALLDKQPRFEGQPTSFAPDAPTHQAPNPSAHSAELKRKSRFISNPYAQPDPSLAPQQVANAFAPAQDPNQQVPQTISSTDFAPSGDFSPAGDFAPKGELTPSNKFQPNPADVASFGPTRNQQQNSFVPTESAGQLDERNDRDTSTGNQFLSQAAGTQKNPFMPQSQTADSHAQQMHTGPVETPAPSASPDSIALTRPEPFKSATGTASELAEPTSQTFGAKPKIVLNDKFFGKPAEPQIQLGPGSGNYQAKINLPEPKSNDFVPADSNASSDVEALADSDTSTTETDSVEELAEDIAQDSFQPSTSYAIPVASSKVVASSAELAEPISNALEVAPVKTTAPDYALHGKCPVTLLAKSKWVDGNPEWGCVHRNRTYIFSSEQNLKIFQADPDANSPILAGYDPVIYQETGRLVDGLEKHGVFMGIEPRQRIVLFDNAESRARFQSEPKKYLEAVRQAMLQTGASSKLLR